MNKLDKLRSLLSQKLIMERDIQKYGFSGYDSEFWLRKAEEVLAETESGTEHKYIKELEKSAEEACKKAFKRRRSFKDAAVNWVDFHCYVAEKCIQSDGNIIYRVWLEEASPRNEEVQKFIMNELKKCGFEHIEVNFEW